MAGPPGTAEEPRPPAAEPASPPPAPAGFAAPPPAQAESTGANNTAPTPAADNAPQTDAPATDARPEPPAPPKPPERPKIDDIESNLSDEAKQDPAIIDFLNAVRFARDVKFQDDKVRMKRAAQALMLWHDFFLKTPHAFHRPAAVLAQKIAEELQPGIKDIRPRAKLTNDGTPPPVPPDDPPDRPQPPGQGLRPGPGGNNPGPGGDRPARRGPPPR